MSAEIQARYFIETSYPLAEAAEILAGEQSCGTFLKTPGETPELVKNHRAKVLEIVPGAIVEQPSLPGAHRLPGRNIQQGTITVSWPMGNIGTHLPNLAATVAGNLFELAPFSALRLLDLEIPTSFSDKYPGPRFGIESTRKLCQVFDRPILGTIIKPSVGLSPEQTAAQVDELVSAGLDFIKDDELQGDAPHCPFDERVSAVMHRVHAHADRTGKQAMYAFNISGSLDEMRRRHDLVYQAGGTCIMLNINWVGLTGVEAMARHTAIPIHGHRNGWGLFSRSPHIGMAFSAYQKLWRLAGVDHLHTNGIRNKFCEADHEVIQSIRDCLVPFSGIAPTMPVLSSGQWAGQVIDTYKAVRSTHLMYLCGGGIVSHPSGMQAGVQSIRQAWDAALNDEDLHRYARNHRELREALAFFDKKITHRK